MSLANFFSTGGSKSKSTAKTYEQVSQTDRAAQLYGAQVGQGQPVYQGTRVAPLSPGQQEAMNLTGWSQYLQPYSGGTTYGQAGQALGEILTGEAGAAPIDQQQIDDLFTAAYEQPAWRNWESQIKPEIRESYSGPGFWSSSRMEAQSQGAQDVANWLNEQYAGLNWEAQQENRALQEDKANRALAAIQPTLAYEQLPQQQTLAALEGRSGMFNLAGAGQQQEQNEINAAIQKFTEQNRLTDPESLQALLALLNVSTAYSTDRTYPPGMGLAMLQGLSQSPGGSASVSVG